MQAVERFVAAFQSSSLAASVQDLMTADTAAGSYRLCDNDRARMRSGVAGWLSSFRSRARIEVGHAALK